MKAVWLVTGFCALGCAALVGKAFQAQAFQTQSAPTQAESAKDANRIVLDVTRVNMLFTVTDKKGRFITNLTQNDFEVIESKRKQTIQTFTAESDLPLRLAILIDTSNSIRERFHFQQEAATAFIDGTVRPDHDKAMIVSFDTAAELHRQRAAHFFERAIRQDVIRGRRPMLPRPRRGERNQQLRLPHGLDQRCVNRAAFLLADLDPVTDGSQQHDHRFAELGIRLNGARQLGAVHARHLVIEKREMVGVPAGLRLPERLERLFASRKTAVAHSPTGDLLV